MFTEILDPQRTILLKKLVSSPLLSPFYLGGGTALSLQLGLRVSVDFDFFAQNKFSPDVLYTDLKQVVPDTKLVYSDRDTCDLLIQQVQVSFFRYPYPLVNSPACGVSPFSGLKMASVDDIAAMKLSAIGSRGSRKDFYDLYQIYHIEPGFQSERLISAVHQKFGQDFDMTYMVMALNYFENAEAETLPKLFIHADWDQIKQFFTEEQKKLFAMVQSGFSIP